MLLATVALQLACSACSSASLSSVWVDRRAKVYDAKLAPPLKALPAANHQWQDDHPIPALPASAKPPPAVNDLVLIEPPNLLPAATPAAKTKSSS